MRYLFVSMPERSHLFPMVPLAHAARLAGHHVLVGISGGAVRLAADAGLPVVDVAPGSDLASIYTKLMVDIMAPGLSDEELMGLMVEGYSRIGDRALDGIVRLARDWQADAVVFEPGMSAGLLAAREVGIPGVVHGVGLRHPVHWAMAGMEPVLDRLSLTELPQHPDFEIKISPDSLERLNAVPGEDESVVTVLPMRGGSCDGGASVDRWALRSGPRPRILAGFGSVPVFPGGGELLAEIVRGTAGLGVELVINAGDADLSALPKPLPEHVRTVDRLPLSVLLPSCAAILHDAAMGTMYAAFAAGVPQVSVPPSPGEPAAHAVAERRGAGVTLLPSEVTAERVAKTVREVVESPGYRTASREVAAEMAAMPDPYAVASRLTELIR